MDHRRSVGLAAILAGLVLLLAFFAPGVARAAGPRAVSINLCTDQLLLALADPDQIWGVSPYARDRARSRFAAEAARYPILSGGAEDVLVSRPDFVLAGTFTRRATRELLAAQGLRVLALPPADSLDETRRQFREVGLALRHPDRAEAEVARLDAALARAKDAAGRGRFRPLAVLPLERRGWVPGGQTLTNAILSATGLANAGAAARPGYGGQVTLERIVAMRPDLLLVTGEARRAEDQGTAFLEHPALVALYPPEKRLVLSEGLLACGGPALPDALEQLTAQIRRVMPAP